MRVRWRLVVFTVFSVQLNLTGMAQGTGDNEIVTDRPDITESAIVVPTASLQAENGATWTSGHYAKGLDICQSLLRIGVGDATDQFALGAFAGNNDCFAVLDAKSAFFDVQTQFGFARFLIGAMAGITFVRQDRADLPIVINDSGRSAFGARQKHEQQRQNTRSNSSASRTTQRIISRTCRR